MVCFPKDGSIHIEVFCMRDGSFIRICDIEEVSKYKEATMKEKELRNLLSFSYVAR